MQRHSKAYSPEVFERACQLAHTPITPRQLSKWRNKKGIARKFMDQAKAQLAKEAREKLH